jgi:glycine dehydrogenase
MSAMLKQSAATPQRPSLAELEQHDAFCARHIGPDAAEQAAMLAVLGYSTRAALIDAVVRSSARATTTRICPA